MLVPDQRDRQPEGEVQEAYREPDRELVEADREPEREKRHPGAMGEATREALAIRVARSIDADHAVRVLDQIDRP
jgi:hypothetical protein